MAKSKRTPNQRLYQKQRQRLRRIEREYQQKLGVTNIPSVVPQLPAKVTKLDIERLRKITPEKFREKVFKQVQEYVPDVDKPVKVYQYKPRRPLTEREKLKRTLKRAENKLNKITDHCSNEYSEASAEYSKAYDELQDYDDNTLEAMQREYPDLFTSETVDTEEVQEDTDHEYEELPEPPHKQPFYDDETGVWIDLSTGELLDPLTKEPIGDEELPEKDYVVLQNLMSDLSSATNAYTADVVMQALNEEIEKVGRDVVSDRLDDAYSTVYDLASEIAEDSKGDNVKSNAVQLIELIRGGSLTVSDQFRLNEAWGKDQRSWVDFKSAYSRARSRSRRRT